MPSRRQRKQVQNQPLGPDGRQQAQPQASLQPLFRAETPPLISREVDEAAPSSPIADRVEPHCPQPRRGCGPVFAALFPPTGSAASANDWGIADGPGSPWSAGDVSDELRELFSGGGAVKEDAIAPDGPSGYKEGAPVRPLSSVSTSAGPTPSPDDRAITPMSTSWLAPDRYSTPATEDSVAETRPSSRAADLQSEKQSNAAQNRKVFVGGIPQDMEHDDLYNIFSEYAGVKKAWLQRHRGQQGADGLPGHNHRGFGFVIFYDATAVDQILGSSFSRFIDLHDGRRLEVKRAVSSTDMTRAPSSASAAAPPPRASRASAPAAMAAQPQQPKQQPQPQHQHQHQVPQPLPQPLPQPWQPQPQQQQPQQPSAPATATHSQSTAAPQMLMAPVASFSWRGPHLGQAVQVLAQPQGVPMAAHLGGAAVMPQGGLGLAAQRAMGMPAGGPVVGGAMAQHAAIQFAFAAGPQQLVMSPAPQLALTAGQQGALPAQWMPQGAVAGVPTWQMGAQEAAVSAPAAHGGPGQQQQQQ